MIDISEIDERIAKCEKILSSNPGSQIFAALAEAHRKKGELDKAFQVCQKGLKSHPDYGSAHLVMARINLDKGMLDWAETEIEKAAKLGGNAHSIEILRCEVLLSKGQIEEAIERLKKLLKSDPGNDQIKKLMQTAESARKLPGARPAGENPEVKAPSLFQGEPNSSGTKTAPAPVAREEKPKKKARTLTAKELMSGALAMSGAFGAIRMDFDGNTLDANWNNVGSEEEFAAMSSNVVRQMMEAFERVRFGAPTGALIEAGNLSIYIITGEREAFAFAGDEKVNASRMRAAVNHLYRDYENCVNDPQK